jgi:hypothetical protein
MKEQRAMKTHSEEQFLKWVKAHDMGLDERYPDAAVLTFKPDPALSRFWVIPSKPELRSYFLALILNLIGKWQSCRVWRHMGSWPQRPNQHMNGRVEFQILKGIGMPMGTADIVEFRRSERDQLTTLLFSTTVFGWSCGEDLYVVPNGAQHIIRTSHHDVVHVAFRQRKSLRQFVKGMEKEKFPLPKTVPDWTFEIPDWMGKE